MEGFIDVQKKRQIPHLLVAAVPTATPSIKPSPPESFLKSKRKTFNAYGPTSPSYEQQNEDVLMKDLQVSVDFTDFSRKTPVDHFEAGAQDNYIPNIAQKQMDVETRPIRNITEDKLKRKLEGRPYGKNGKAMHAGKKTVPQTPVEEMEKLELSISAAE